MKLKKIIEKIPQKYPFTKANMENSNFFKEFDDINLKEIKK